MPVRLEALGDDLAQFLSFSAEVRIEEVLRTFLEQKGNWATLLTTEKDGKHYVCSFGSLLPYLTGRTPHIIHKFGQCPDCSMIPSLLWRDTTRLLDEAIQRDDVNARLVSDLPMAELTVVEKVSMGTDEFFERLSENRLRVCGIAEKGVIVGICVVRMRFEGMPDF